MESLNCLEPDRRGTYLLVANMPQSMAISIGRLGTFAFPTGWYVYAGSALGFGGLPARIARHRRQDKHLHWHIDYLLAHSVLVASWEIRSTDRLECAWAAAMSCLPDAVLAVPGFGASDCGCPGHLIHFPHCPVHHLIEKALCAASPGQDTLCHHVYEASTGR